MARCKRRSSSNLPFGEGITSRFTRREQAGMPLIGDMHACSHDGEMLEVRVFLAHLPDNRFDTLPFGSYQDCGTIDRESWSDAQSIHITDRSKCGSQNYAPSSTYRQSTDERSVCSRSLSFEIPSSTEWAFQSDGSASPECFCRYADTLSLKVQAILRL